MSPIDLCGADTAVRERPGAIAASARANLILAAIGHSFRVLVATLSEIFDESAYRRFLVRSQLESSPNAYAIFLKENEQSRARRPRCC